MKRLKVMKARNKNEKMDALSGKHVVCYPVKSFPIDILADLRIFKEKCTHTCESALHMKMLAREPGESVPTYEAKILVRLSGCLILQTNHSKKCAEMLQIDQKPRNKKNQDQHETIARTSKSSSCQQ